MLKVVSMLKPSNLDEVLWKRLLYYWKLLENSQIYNTMINSSHKNCHRLDKSDLKWLEIDKTHILFLYVLKK